MSEVAQSCPTLCDPMVCSPPGSSIHGIFQARILKWVVISFSGRSSGPRDWTPVSHIVSQFSLSVVSNSATPWTAARQASLSITNCWRSITNPNPCPLSRWCHPAISSSVIPFVDALPSEPPGKSNNGILLSHKREQSKAIYRNVDGPRDYHAKWSKSNRERQILYDITHIWTLIFKDDTNELICKTEPDVQIPKTNLWLPKGKGGRGEGYIGGLV